MKSVTVSAPGKLLLMGDHAVVYDRPCLVAAIDKRISVTVTVTSSADLRINAPDIGLEDYQKDMSELTKGDVPEKAEYIEQAVFEFGKIHDLPTGLSITTSAPKLDSRFGFGTSAATLAATVSALNELLELKLDKKQLLDIAYKAVITLKGVGSGADIAASLYGSVLCFVTGGREIREIPGIETTLIAAYAGYKGDTAKIIKELAKRRSQDLDKINAVFDSITKLVRNGENALKDGNNQKLGSLMSQHNIDLQALGVSTQELDDICQIAVENGALGAKISGAGGGDCAISLVNQDREKQVVSALQEAGYATMIIDIAKEGVRVEKSE